MWTGAIVKARMREAAWTVRGMPAPDAKVKRALKGGRTPWPECVRATWDAGLDGLIVKPSPVAITKAEEAAEWLLWLPELERRVVWARAQGVKWWRIAAAVGSSERTCEAMLARAHETIAMRLSLRKTPLAPSGEIG
jgi:hypothetical protein